MDLAVQVFDKILKFLNRYSIGSNKSIRKPSDSDYIKYPGKYWTELNERLFGPNVEFTSEDRRLLEQVQARKTGRVLSRTNKRTKKGKSTVKTKTKTT